MKVASTSVKSVPFILLRSLILFAILIVSFKGSAQVTFGSPSLIRSFGPTYGNFTVDASTGKYYAMPDFTTSTVYEYSSLANFVANSPVRTISLPSSYAGTGAAVYNGSLYYNQLGGNTLVKYNLTTLTVSQTAVLSGAGSMNSYPYGWGGYSDIDFAVDESGLWVMYSTAANSGKLVVSKLDPNTLALTQTWNTSSPVKTQMGNAFIINGIVYCIANYYQASGNSINYTYNTSTSTGTTVNIPFTGGNTYNSSTNYDPLTKQLYSWNNANVYSYTTGTPATALNFDGINDYVNIPNPFTAYSKELTVEWSVNISPLVQSTGMGIGQSINGVDGTSSMVWLMHHYNGSFQFYVSDNGTWKSAEAPVSSGWHRFVGVADASSVRIYMDGNLIQTTTPGVNNSILNVPGSVIQFGKDVRYNTGRFMTGSIDEVRIWSRALCQGEIQNNNSCELSGTQTGLQEYYKFNQGYVNQNNSTETTLPDLSGNNRNGNLVNFALSGSTSNWVAGTISGSCSAFVPPAATITASGSTTICQGGSVTLTANSGSSYLWSNGATTPSITVSVAGNYSVTVTQSTGCSGTSAPTTVTVNPIPTVSVTANGPTSFCPSGSVTLTASGANSYLWSSGQNTSSITVNQSNTYSVTGTSNGCSSSAVSTVVTVSDNVPPVIACPSNIVVNADPQSCGATVNYSVPTATDNCGAVVQGSQTFNYSGNIVNFTVPAGVTSITVDAYGAQGGGGTIYGTSLSQGGKGAFIEGTVSVTPGEVLRILVGQMGGSSGGPHGNENGGGGGSFVVRQSGNIPLIVAGGGGGAPSSSYGTSCSRNVSIANGQTSTSGSSISCYTSAAGGVNGNGGNSQGAYQGGAGGGFYTDGATGGTHCSTAFGGQSFLNGGAGGLGNNCYNTNNYGGFGGGGGGQLGGPGGGGGYSGGASAGSWSSFSTYGGGGGSYNSGTNQTNIAGYKANDGQVVLSWNSNTGPTVTQVSGLASGATFPVGVTTNTFKATDASGNSSTCSFTVTVNPAAAATITAGGPTTFCQGGSVTLTASPGNSYLWSNGATTQSITVNTSGSFSVTVTYSGTCSSTSSPVTVTVNPSPAATITADGPTSFCQGGSVTLTASAGNSFLWSNGATTQSITVNTSGDYTVIVTNENNCSATSSPVSVTVNSLPVATITASGATTFCQGGSVTLTASPGASYLWSDGSITQSISVNASGNYRVVVINENNCSATSSPVTVTVNSLPVATITANGPTTFCQGGSVTLTASPAGSYLWNNGATTQSITVSTSGTYTVTITNNGCSASASTTVKVNANPIASIAASGATTFCEGGSVTLAQSNNTNFINAPQASGTQVSCNCPTGYVAVGYTGRTGSWMDQMQLACKQLLPDGTLGSSIVYTSTNGTSAGGSPRGDFLLPANNVMVGVTGYNGPANYMSGIQGYGQPVSYIQANGNNTSGYTTASLLIGANSGNLGTVFVPNGSVITGMIGWNTFYTSGFSFVYTPISQLLGQPGGIQTYLWSNGATTPSINATTSGNYSLTVTQDNCSTTSSPIAVTVNPLPTAFNVTGGGAYCSGGSGVSIALSGSQTGVSYQLKLNGNNVGAALSGTGSSLNFGNQVSAGTYTVSATSSSNCTANMNGSATVTINSLPSAIITADGPVSFCQGGSVTLTASSGTSYLWSNGATSSSITVNASGNYSVTVTNASNCSAVSAPVTVTVNNNPVIAISPSNTTICSGSSATLTAGGITAGLVGYWKFDEASGTSVADASGNNLTGSFVGSPTRLASTAFAAAGNTLDFNSNSYIDVPDNAVFNSMQTNLSIEAWIYQTDNANNTIVDRANYNFLFETMPNGQSGLGFYNPNNGWSYSSTPLPQNQWVHVACTWDGSTKTLRFYVNGNQTDVFVRPSSLYFNPGPLNIARQEPNSCRCNIMSGRIDELRLWNIVKSQSQIQASMNSSLPSGSAGIASYAWSPATGLNTTTGSTVVASPASTTTYTVTATTTANCTATATATVNVNTAPVITCPSNITVNAANGQCGANVTYPVPATATGTPAPTITYSIPSGSMFNVGVTTVTATATNSCGSTSCTFTVTVIDNVPPTIICPSNQSINLDANCSATLPDYRSLLSATDACGVVTITQTPAPGTALTGTGTTTVNFTVKDASGNITPCSFILTKRDVTPPTITCTAPISVNNDAGVCGAKVTYAAPTASDNCGSGSSVTYDPAKTVLYQGRVYYLDGSGGQCAAGYELAPQSILGQIAGMFVGKTYFSATSSNCCIIHKNEASELQDWGMNTDCNRPGIFLQGPILGGAGCTNAFNHSSNQLTFCQSSSTLATVNVVQLSGLPSGSVFPVGITTNTFEATDSSGNKSTCSFTVTVTDAEAPKITCPSNINAIATSAAGAVVNYAAPVGTDNCSGVTTVRIAGPASGSTFPIGTTTITHRVTDAAGNSSQCSFTITVAGLAPSIVCPQNIMVNNTTGQCGTNVSFAATETTAIPASTISYSLQPGSFFSVGTTTVTATATNAVGTSTCTFTVTVNDAEQPKLADVPSNTTVECDAVPAAAHVTATDNCPNVGAVQYSEVRTNGNCPNNYTLTRTWTVTDSHNNTSSATEVITVQDTKAPTITTAALNSTVECDGNGNTAALQSWLANHGGASASDACSSVTWTNNFHELTAGCGNTGSATVTFTATDACGNVSTTTATFTIEDTTAPTITAQASDETAECDGQGNAASVQAWLDNHGGATASDVCSGVHWSNNYNTSGWITDCGGTKHISVTFTATDACGNASTTTATFTIEDHTAPVVTTPAGSLDRTEECSGAQAIADAVALHPSASDDCSSVTMNLVSDVTTNSCGSTYVRVRVWSFTDACGNTSETFKQTITVVDRTAPVITCPASVTLNCQDNNSTAATGVATATDNCSTPAVTYSDASTQSSDVNDAAHYNYVISRTWTATDACGNSSQCVQTITVQDVTNPVITCPASVTLNCQDDNTSASTGKATGTDNCSPVAITETQTSTQSADINSAAHYNYVISRTWRATDVTGNYSECVQTITVQDLTNPVITCPASVTINCQDATTTAANGVATGTDNCSPVAITYSDASTQNSNPNNAGYYNYVITRTWRATDLTGNYSECVQTITVRDVTKPVITCPASLTVNCQDDNTSASTGRATGTDNCGPVAITETQTSTQSADINSAAHYNYVISRTWRATDVTGNYSECVQTITVHDVTKPVITCPASVTINCQDATTTAANGVATGTDNCSPVAITYSDASTQNSNPNNAGYYNYVITRTWRATDVTGNYSECVQTITVRDITAPTPVCKAVTIVLVNGTASITPQMLDGGSWDCSPISLSVNKSSFNCSNIGANTVTLTLKDVSGNVSTCQAVVTVTGEIPTCRITSVPTDATFTGGVPTSLYLGYGAQSTTLQLDVPASGAPYTFSWSGNGALSSTSVQSPLFAPTRAGYYTFTVFITNKYGCTTTCTINICVTDVRVLSSNGTWDGKKVYVCHVPPGNPGNSNTLSISVNAVPSHIGMPGHGTDRLGKCEVPACVANNPVARGTVPTTPAVQAAYIKAYPNPTTGVFELLLQNYGKGKVNVQVVDNYGKLVAQQNVTVTTQSQNVTMDVTKHASGVYYVRVISEDGVKTLEVVVAR